MERPQRIRELLETTDSIEEEEEVMDLDEILASCLDDLEEKHDADMIRVYSDEDPYEIVEMDETTRMFQVVGNEIIFMTRAEGYCCLCHQHTLILYVDNSYGTNIPAQLCRTCIDKIIS